MGVSPGLRLAAAAGAVAALAGALPVPAGAEPAPTSRSVVASGRAQGFRATYTIPDYVVVSEFFDGGGPVTDAVADSTGRATSFASLPWPGENAVTAPGTLSVALGQSVPLAYPFYVRADHPTTPAAELNDPTGSYAITASAAADRAAATGRLQGGQGVSGSSARTSAVLDDAGVVRVVAETVDTGLSIGDGLLRIAAVRSRSETTLGPDDAEPVTRRELVIEGATVADQPVTISADGVHAGDQAVPAPVGQGGSSDNDLLGQAGISVTIAPTGRPGSADALVITSRQTIPAPNNPKGHMVLRVGGASSEIVVGSADFELDPGLPADAAPVDRSASSPAPDADVSGPDAVPEPVAGPGAADGRTGGGPDRFGTALPGAGAAQSGAPEFGPSPSGASPFGAPQLGSPAGQPTAAPAERGTLLQASPAAGAGPPPVLPDLATTGALFSLLATGGVALLAGTRLHRIQVTKVRR